MSIRPGADPIHHVGSTTSAPAVLLIHGFTGSPVAMAPWAQFLADHGLTVKVPRLPGHGTSWQEMNSTTWHDWFGEVEAALAGLRADGGPVVVGGLSMGGGLALRLAERHPSDVAGLMLVNPAVKVEDPRLKALPVIKHLIRSLPGISNDIKKPGQDEGAYDRIPLKALHSQVGGWSEVIAELPKVTAPLLLMRSRVDHIVPASSSALILERISSPERSELVLEDSFHVATLDNDAPTIFQRSLDFIQALGDTDRP